MSAPYRINEDEFLKRLFYLMERLKPHTDISMEDVNEMFNLYNDRLLPKETGRSCSSCRLRVYNRLLAYYKELNLKNE